MTVHAELDPAAEFERVAGMLHDDVLQCVIAARWALDSIDLTELSRGAAKAVDETARALDRSQQLVRDHIAQLRRYAGAAGAPEAPIPAP